MSDKKPMTAGDLKKLLEAVPDDYQIYIPSPDGSLINNENLYLETFHKNWWGNVVFIKCRSWRLIPEN